MKDAGVDFVFMAAPNLIGPTVVQAAVNLDFHPQWAANGNQVTDTVSQFFEAVKDEWDGAIGVSTVFAQIDDLSDEAHALQRDHHRAQRRGLRARAPTPSASPSVNCITMQMLQPARRGDRPGRGQPGDGDPRRSRASARSRSTPGRPARISADKHNAGDYLFLADYSADDREFVDRPGEPVAVDG